MTEQQHELSKKEMKKAKRLRNRSHTTRKVLHTVIGLCERYEQENFELWEYAASIAGFDSLVDHAGNVRPVDIDWKTGILTYESQDDA